MMEGETPSSPFTAILDKVMGLGGFPKGVGIIAFTASLAAIMSTADSLIIAISQLVTAEIVYPIRPNSSPKQIAWIGRGVSLLTCGLALVIGLLWKQGITALGKIQFALSMQAVPAFLIGLYASPKFDFHPWCVSFGAMISAIYIFIIYFAYLDKNSDAAPIDPGITGFAIQMFVTCTTELGYRFIIKKVAPPNSNGGKKTNDREEDTHQLHFPNRPEWDVPPLARFGQHALTPKLLSKMMEGVKEPFMNLWYALLMFITISMITPLTEAGVPGIDEEGNFISPPAIINGMPWWAFKILLLTVVPHCLILITLIQTPNQYPIDEKKIEKFGVDPDIVELTPQEMGRRQSYDERNVMVYSRRSQILKAMSDRGLKLEEDEEDDTPVGNARPILSSKSLSAMVLGSVPMEVLKEKDEEFANDEKAKSEDPKEQAKDDGYA